MNISSKRKYTDEGFLQVPAHISRIGTQDYLAIEMGLSDREPTSIVTIYRPESEVFNDDSLSSFASKPVTNNHPPELVTASNSKEFTVGLSSPDVVRDGELVKTTLNITDADAIKAIESGKVELSNGYTCDIDWTPGVTPNGIKYDAIQRNIKGNHIAIVEQGRAGNACRVADSKTTNGDQVTMAKITVDGVDFEVSDQAAQAIGKLQARLADAETNAEEIKKKEDEAEEMAKEAKKTEDSLQAKLDDALSKIPTDEALDKLIADRMSVVDAAKKVISDLDYAGKSSADLMSEVVAAKCPTVQMDSVSADYIKARFDMLVEDASANTQHQLDDALKTQLNDSDKVEDSRPASVIAREKMMADSRNAWKGAK